MTNIEKIVDALTGAEILQDYTPAQEADAKATKAELDKLAKIAETKAAEKAALLEKLGITADEADLLLS